VIQLITFSLLNASSMAFVGASAYIYQDIYGLSPRTYSYFFAFNALCMMGGPFLYMALTKITKRSNIIIIGLILSIVSGAAAASLAGFGPFAFAIAIVPSFIAGSCLKPPGMLLMLDQQKKDTGSASSLIMSAMMIMGTLGIVCASIKLWNFAIIVGIITGVVSAISLTLWIPYSLKHRSPKQSY
jgi:DHA1 family bicyclomycin/chloramphenicol resistance-like MFS transporter